MRTPKIKKEFLGALIVLAMGVIASYAIVVRAQTNLAQPAADNAVVQGIAFPVAELGNCASKSECKAYCDDSAHMEACIKFAQDHGLMNKEEVSRAEKFRQKLQSGGGPGGCTSPRDCEAFCGDTRNLEACVKFAKEQDFKDGRVEEGEKILAYMKAGGQMPGGCTSKESCGAYCNNFNHAEECFEFVKKAGISEGRGQGGARSREQFERDGPSVEEFEKFIELVKSGDTPGGCKSKDECEAYCREGSHHEECTDFGVKIGFISAEEAVMIRKTGGKGPGGCDSQESCRAYCNDPMNRDMCFKFAEEHGFMNSEEAVRAKEGFTRLRAGLDQAPPEIAECLKSTIGPNIIEDIQSGKLVPGPEVGDRVKGCFEKFGRRGDPKEVFKNAPPEVLACLKEKLGGDQFALVTSGKTMPTPETADTLRICFQKIQFQGGFSAGSGLASHGPSPEMIKNFLRSAPPEVMSCLKEKLGSDFEKVASGEQTRIDTSKLRSCFEQFRPSQPDFNRGSIPGQSSGQFPNTRPPEGAPPTLGFPPAVVECAKNFLGVGWEIKLRSGDISSDIKSKIYACATARTSGQTQPAFQPPLGGGFTNLPPAVITCVKEKVPSELLQKFLSGQTIDEVVAIVRQCIAQFNQPTTGDSSKICPTMPTVESCPAGQFRKITYSSPECGIYYSCVAETYSPPPSGTVCAQDARQCPDGSYVSRRGPNCEFALCPTTAPPPPTY